MEASRMNMMNKLIYFLKVSLLMLLLFSCDRHYKIYIEPRNGDVFYQYIKDTVDANSVITISTKDKRTLLEYIDILNTMILVLNMNKENFDNPIYVSKEIVLTVGGTVDFRDISAYRLVYDPEHPLAETVGMEKGFVRYYSSNIKADDEACSYYRSLKDAFEKAIAEINADIRS